MIHCTAIRAPVLRISLAGLLLLGGPPGISAEPATASSQRAQPNHVTIDASAPISPPETGYLHLGGISASGHSLQVNSRYLTLDGKPWLPVMGEIHFSRIPEEEWEPEILKMKAAGIDIVSAYVFWIHHEEVEGQFDWSGRRDLRKFVELCAKHGMYVYLRPGPWAHGEARNGGFPDWVAKLPNTRSNDPVYLKYVIRFFGEIGKQLQGLMWKDGGPVIGSQLENEYPDHGPGRGAEHILRLKEIAIAAGIDPPLFSVTGWPSLDFPPREVIPVSGGYPDGFWFGSQTNLPPSMNYLFNFNRELGDMGATVPSNDPTGKVDLKHDPYFAAEEAGGMATSYHRRPVLSADDIAALTLIGIGSGVNLYGYYMFHGGTNPPGKLSTLQESQATGYPNDLPQIDYDFQAPIGAFGQIRESYRKTRLLHLFLNSFGSQLAPMVALGPGRKPGVSVDQAAADASTPRVAVRTDGKSGYVFLNNYVRQLAMPERKGFQVTVRLPSGDLTIPRNPVDIPAGAYLLWPFNLALHNSVLRYSTAQPLTQYETAEGTVAVFFATPGIAAEFAFDASSIASISAPGAAIHRDATTVFVHGLAPGMNATIRIEDKQGNKTTILLLTQAQAEHCVRLRLGNEDLLALSGSDVFSDGGHLHLLSTASSDQGISILTPGDTAPGLKAQGNSTLSAPQRDGLWLRYTVTQPARTFSVKVVPVRPSVPRASMAMGPVIEWRKGSVPQAPEESAFKDAAIWQIQIESPGKSSLTSSGTVPKLDGLSDLYLDLEYTGDIAHLSSSAKLLDDNFFNGIDWQIGLARFATAGFDSPLSLAILPMPAVAPIYLDENAHYLLASHPGAQLIHATLVPQYETVLAFAPPQ